MGTYKIADERVKLSRITKDVAVQVWACGSLSEKKEFLLNYIGDCNTQEELKIRHKINYANNSTQIDMIVSNLLLKTEGHGVLSA